MPTVPVYNGPRIGTRGLPASRARTTRAVPQLPDVAGQQASNVGRALTALGRTTTAIAVDQAREANQARFDDAANRAKEAALQLRYDRQAGFTNLRGVDALSRPDGKALGDEYRDRLRESLNAIEADLGTDVQRSAFGRFRNDLERQFYTDAVRHEAQQLQNYQLSVSQGIQSTALREVSLSWADAQATDLALNRIKTEVQREAQLLGKSPEWADARTMELTSQAHREALRQAIDAKQLDYADAYLNRYAADMDAGDLIDVREAINSERETLLAYGVGNLIADSNEPRGAFDAAFEALIRQESRGRQFDKNGNVLTSSAGALGIAQIMPGTGPEAAKLAGLPWDANRLRSDAAYNRALGAAYFRKQLQDNNGDLARAYAAYNAGPGRLREGLKRAEQAGTPGAWLQYMPKETQDYVRINTRRYQENMARGKSMRPMAELDRELRSNPLVQQNPEIYEKARRQMERRYGDRARELKQQSEQVESVALQAILENGGDYDAIPQAIRDQLPPDRVTSVMAFADKIREHGDVETDDAVYAKLAANTDKLRNLTDDQFTALRLSLSERDFRYFARKRGEGASSSDDWRALDSGAVNRNVNQWLNVLRIDPTPPEGKKAAARVGAVRRFVDRALLDAQQAAGRKFTDAEVAAYIDRLFQTRAASRDVLFEDGLLGMLDLRHGITSERLLEMDPRDIPDDMRKGIEAGLRADGIDEPTDEQIIHEFWTLEWQNATR